jgi:transcriptional regulator with XRE-family HTH domain
MLDNSLSAAVIGERLRLTREALRLNQREFCERTGLKTSAYNKYEKGVKRPSVDAAIVLCEYYGLTLEWIFRGDQSRLPNDLVNGIAALRRRS